MQIRPKISSSIPPLLLAQSFLGILYPASYQTFCQTPVLGLGLGVDFTFAWDNHNNHSNPHLNFVKRTVLGDKEQGVGIRDLRNKG